MQAEATGVSFVASNRCSSFPVSSPAVAHDSFTTPPQTITVLVPAYSNPGGVTQTEVHRCVSQSRAWQKRGPPSLTPLG